jgi:hypothetical protein
MKPLSHPAAACAAYNQQVVDDMVVELLDEVEATAADEEDVQQQQILVAEQPLQQPLVAGDAVQQQQQQPLDPEVMVIVSTLQALANAKRMLLEGQVSHTNAGHTCAGFISAGGHISMHTCFSHSLCATTDAALLSCRSHMAQASRYNPQQDPLCCCHICCPTPMIASPSQSDHTFVWLLLLLLAVLLCHRSPLVMSLLMMTSGRCSVRRRSGP